MSVALERDHAPEIDLQLFATDPAEARGAVAAGVTTFVVDWEWRGKHGRQSGFDTEINCDSVEDLARLAGVAGSRRVCRLNRFGPWTPAEVEAAVGAGAWQLLLPMVVGPAEVEAFLRSVRGRVRAGILVETAAACRCAGDLAGLGLDAVYVGLNDLAISRGTGCIFTALVDGTVERLRETFAATPFGFGGLTVIELGCPVPCLRLLEEMARLRAEFTFLRRSFRRDIAGRDAAAEVAHLQRTWRALLARESAEETSDHARLVAAVELAAVAAAGA